MENEGKCTDYNSCVTAYNGSTGTPGLLEGAYKTIIGYWGHFPSSVGLASMFVNSGNASFPFNTNISFGLALLNDVHTYSSTRSIMMNNAAQNGTNGLVNPIRCYAGTQDSMYTCPTGQPTSTIAFQEVGQLYVPPPGPGCTNFYALLTAASPPPTGANSAFMETYGTDITSCP